MGCIAVGIYSTGNGQFKIFDSHARDLYGRGHPQGTCVLLQVPSKDNLVQYIQSIYASNDVFELKGIHIVENQNNTQKQC